MKLLFISNLFPDQTQPYRGLDNATILHRLASKEDFEIRVIALRPSLPVISRSADFACREIDRIFSPRFLRVPYIPKIGSRFNHRLTARALRPAVEKMRADFAFDVVLGSWIFPDGCAISEVARRLDFPWVVVAQGSDVHQYLKMPARKKIIVRAMQTPRAIITRSAELGRLLRDAGVPPEKLHTVYNGVDFEIFRPGDARAARHELGLPLDPEKARVILFVGNFVSIKNPLLLVRAHAELCRLEPELDPHLVMIGGGPLESAARKLADKNGFGKKVILAGRKHSREVARFMQAADVLCLPSENEGVPNVILEAFACGLRVVAARVGGIPEVLNHDFLGRLIDAPGMQELVFALAEELPLSAQTDLRDAVHRHGLQFSWESAAGAYRAILHSAATAA